MRRVGGAPAPRSSGDASRYLHVASENDRPISRPSITMPPSKPVTLLLDQDSAHARQAGDGRGGAVDLRRPDRARHVVIVDRHDFVDEAQPRARGERGDFVLVVERHAVVDGLPANGAVHRAAVDVTVAELRSDGARHCSFSCT